MENKKITLEEATKIIEKARKTNDGEWIEHCYIASKVAGKLAEALGLDIEKAKCMGLLHDIGRKDGRMGLRHAINGYKYMNELGYQDIARICMTHSFFENTIEGCIGKFDMSEEEKSEIKQYIENIEFDEYDRLIQLSDNLSSSTGVVTQERRLVDVFFRYGFNENTKNNIYQRLNVQDEIEQKLGYPIYKLFPEVLEPLQKEMLRDVVAFLK